MNSVLLFKFHFHLSSGCVCLAVVFDLEGVFSSSNDPLPFPLRLPPFLSVHSTPTLLHLIALCCVLLTNKRATITFVSVRVLAQKQLDKRGKKNRKSGRSMCSCSSLVRQLFHAPNRVSSILSRFSVALGWIIVLSFLHRP